MQVHVVLRYGTWERRERKENDSQQYPKYFISTQVEVLKAAE
jgi:hypothetical protein